MANQQLRFELLGDASDLVSSFAKTAAGAEKVEANMEGLQEAAKSAALGQVRYNEAAEQFVDQSGAFVSEQRAQAELFEELRAAGVKTEAMYEAQIRELERLENAVEDGSLAQQQLAARQEQVQREMLETAEAAEQAGSGMDAMAGPAGEISFLMGDLRQFQFGVAEGMRAIGNNIPQVIGGFSRATSSGTSLLSMMTGTGGLILAINAAVTAVSLFGEELFGLEGAFNSAKEAGDDFTSVMQERLSRLADQRDLEQVDEIIRQIQGRIEELRDLQPTGGEDLIVGFQTQEGDFVPSEEAPPGGIPGAEAITATRRIEQLQSELKAVRQRRETISDEVSRANALRRTGVDIQSDQTQEASKTTSEQKETTSELEEQQDKIVELQSTLEMLEGPQGRKLARARRIKEQFQRQVELQKQLNRLQQEALPEGFQTDSPGANLFQQQQSEQFARNLQAGARAIDQMAARQQTLNNLVPDPSRIEAANLSLREMLQIMQQVVSQSGVGALNVDKFIEKVSQVGDRLLKFDIADTPLQAVRTQIRYVKQSLKVLRKEGVDPASQEVQKLKDELESLQRAAVGLQIAQQAGLQLATRGFNQLGRAIAGADDAAEKFKQTIVSTLQTVGQALLSSSIAGPLGLPFALLGGGFTAAGGALSLAEGGVVRGAGGPTDDQIPAMLSNQEFVMQAASARMAPEALQAMNEDPAMAHAFEKMFVEQEIEAFAEGGFASSTSTPPSSTMQAEQRLQAASQERKITFEHKYDFSLDRINGREIAVVLRNAESTRKQYGYNNE